MTALVIAAGRPFVAALVIAATLGFIVWELTHSWAWVLALFLGPALVELYLFLITEAPALKQRAR